jgi:hypothetical protein
VTTMPAMKMSSSWKEEQVERGESMVVAEFSASSSIRISWSRQLALQNAFSPLQERAYKKNSVYLFLVMQRTRTFFCTKPCTNKQKTNLFELSSLFHIGDQLCMLFHLIHSILH